MTDLNTQHPATDVNLAIEWVSALVQTTNPETASIRGAVIEAARIIACAKQDVKMSAEAGKNLHLDYYYGELDEEERSSLFMHDAIDRASEALLCATDKRDSISQMIGYDVGPGDKVGRKQGLVNILSLFHNHWACEEAYLAFENWGQASTIDFYSEKLAGLIDEVEFLDTDDVKIGPVTSRATAKTAQVRCKVNEPDHLGEMLVATEA